MRWPHDGELKQAKVRTSSHAQLVTTGGSVEVRGLGAAAAGAALKLVELGRTSQWSVVDQLVTTGDPEELTVAV